MDYFSSLKLDLNDPENPWGSKYSDSMCLEIIDMFSRGKTSANFCGKHVIATNTYEKWRKMHRLFDAACIVAHNQARDHYDELRQKYLVQEFEGASINWGLFNRMYNVRFNIADKRAVKVKGLGKAKTEKEMLKSLANAIEEGELTPDEAQKLACLIDVSLKIKQMCELEDRVKSIEQANKIGVDDEGFETVKSVGT